MASDTMKSWRSASEEEVRELARAWADDADEENGLGHHGDDYIPLFEKHAAEDAKFAAAVRDMWQYKISDENWRRIEAIRRRSEQ